MTYSSSSSHEEGCERSWGWLTKEFVADETGKVTGLKVVELEWKSPKEYSIKPESERVLPCDLAFIAIGYERPVHDAFQAGFNFNLDKSGNFALQNWQTNIKGIFSAGDAFRGQSLVVWAIADGRNAAAAVDQFLLNQEY